MGRCDSLWVQDAVSVHPTSSQPLGVFMRGRLLALPCRGVPINIEVSL